jgi:transcriptional regulator with GAF, ATPase, and Fis domain
MDLAATRPADWLPNGLVDDVTANLLRELLARSAQRVDAENTALWLSSGEFLDPILGSGPHAAHFVGEFRQPLDRGIISYVFASGQPVCENAISANPQHSPLLDQRLGIQTDAMIAVPLVVDGEMAGVITCVHTRPAGSTAQPSEFHSKDLDEFEFAAACLGRLFEASLLNAG